MFFFLSILFLLSLCCPCRKKRINRNRSRTFAVDHHTTHTHIWIDMCYNFIHIDEEYLQNTQLTIYIYMYVALYMYVCIPTRYRYENRLKLKVDHVCIIINVINAIINGKTANTSPEMECKILLHIII